MTMVRLTQIDMEQLEQDIADLHWMARRYANGRMSYAPSMFNEITTRLLRQGFPLKADDINGRTTLFAKDGHAGLWSTPNETNKGVGRGKD